MNNVVRISCFRRGLRNGLILITLFLVLNSVSCTKQFVGRHVNTDAQFWSQINALPSTCEQSDQWFVWKYTIEKGQSENEYVLKGTADPSRGGAKSFSNIVGHESKFSLILANNGTVVDNIRFRLSGGSMGRPISFNRKFECEMPFDSGAIYWEAKVRG